MESSYSIEFDVFSDSSDTSRVYHMPLYLPCVVYIEHMTPINRSFYSGYEVVGKDLSVYELFDICCLKHKYCIDAAARYSTKV